MEADRYYLRLGVFRFARSIFLHRMGNTTVKIQGYMSYVGTRWQCGNFVSRVAKRKDTGVISNMKLTRISFFVWHVYFDVELK